MLFIPTLLLLESTNNVPESILTLPEIVCKDPFNTTLPSIVAFADTVNCPLKSPVLADTTNLPTLFPSNTVLDVGTIAVVFATKPDVEKLDPLTIPE